MSSFPERLKELIERKDVSLREVARSIGVSNSLLSKYQNGIHTPKLEILKNMADYFGVSVEYLSGASDIEGELQKVVKYAAENGLTATDLKGIIDMSIKLKGVK